MHKAKISSVILLISCLSACHHLKIRDLEQRNLRLVLEVDQATGRRYVNEDESACFSRVYRHSKEYLGSVGQEASHDVTHCNDVIGYGPEDYVDLYNFFEDVRLEINKEAKRKRR